MMVCIYQRMVIPFFPLFDYSLIYSRPTAIKGNNDAPLDINCHTLIKLHLVFIIETYMDL